MESKLIKIVVRAYDKLYNRTPCQTFECTDQNEADNLFYYLEGEKVTKTMYYQKEDGKRYTLKYHRQAGMGIYKMKSDLYRYILNKMTDEQLKQSLDHVGALMKLFDEASGGNCLMTWPPSNINAIPLRALQGDISEIIVERYYGKTHSNGAEASDKK